MGAVAPKTNKQTNRVGSFLVSYLVEYKQIKNKFNKTTRQTLKTYIYIYIQGVTGGTDQTSGGCSLC